MKLEDSAATVVDSAADVAVAVVDDSEDGDEDEDEVGALMANLEETAVVSEDAGDSVSSDDSSVSESVDSCSDLINF